MKNQAKETAKELFDMHLKILNSHFKKEAKEHAKITIKFQRKPTYFSRWMNLVNNFLLGICICRNNIVYL